MKIDWKMRQFISFVNPRWRQPPCWILATMRFRCNSWVFIQSRNITTKCVDNWLKIARKASVLFTEFKMAVATMFDSGHQAFFDDTMCCHSKSQYSYHICWNLVYNWKKRHLFSKSRWRPPPFWMLAIGRFSTPWMSFYSKSQHFYQIWWNLVEKWRNSISFVKFKLAAAAMLDSSHQAFYDAIHKFVFKVAAFLSIWWNLAKRWRNSISFLISRWRQSPCWILTNRRILSALVLLFKVATFRSNLLKIGWKIWERHQFQLKELNVPVIFTDKGLLQIRAWHTLSFK